jgi:hypothetical protein
MASHFAHPCLEIITMAQPEDSNTTFRRQPIYDECPLQFEDEWQIRLIELAPGEYHEIVCCRFVVRTDSDPHNYEYTAVTYATEDMYQPINVNGWLFGIPANLVLTLKRLRDQKTPRYAWAGGICINILNPPEEGVTRSPLQGNLAESSCYNILAWGRGSFMRRSSCRTRKLLRDMRCGYRTETHTLSRNRQGL